MTTVSTIMARAEDAVIDLRGCSRETARTYMRGYLRDKETERVEPSAAWQDWRDKMVNAQLGLVTSFDNEGNEI
jgi:hypothetical protein